MNDPATVFTGPRPHVNDPVSSLDGLFIVFDNDQGISEVAQVFQGRNQLAVVTLVKTN